MTGLEASVVARREAEDVAAIYGIDVADILSPSSPKARTARRELAERLVRLMPIKTVQRMLDVSESYVKKVAQSAGMHRWVPPKLVWCVSWDNELIPAETYKRARKYCLEVRARGVVGATVCRKEVGNA
jgi:hypothetical protein